MLAVQLGYKDKKVLTRYFDEFRAKLLARRRALARSQIAQLRRELQPYTRMEPAPSMAEVCRKLCSELVQSSPAQWISATRGIFG